jgi:hypothetical protein
MLLLAAIETTGVATRTDAAPSNRWGTAEVQTDARVALLIDNASSSGEAIVINGAMLSRVPDRPMVVLPHRTPIQRLPQLARTVHEVDV